MGLISILCFPKVCNAANTGGNSLFYWEMNLFQGYSRNDNWFGSGNDSKKSIGIEHYKRFSDDYGDWLITNLQVRLAYDSNVGLMERPFSGGAGEKNALDLEIHNAYARFKLMYGRADVWIGHYEPAFGQEPQLDTYPILLQSLGMKNIGFKKDWGAGVKGVFSNWDYQITATNGSGMGIHFKGNRLFSGRIGIGNPSFDNYNLGFSALYGETAKVAGRRLISDSPVSKNRIGMDASILYGPFDLRGEIARGMDNGKEVFGSWLQGYYLLPSNQRWRVEAQYQTWFYNLKESGNADSTVYLGVSYKLNSAYHLRTYYVLDAEAKEEKVDHKILFQLYYYYPEISGITNLRPE
jgi:hypothetical protein